MAIEAAPFLGAGLLITVLHTIVPDHWLPFVVVGQARRWPLARTLRLTFLSSSIHVGLTILLGLGLALVSLEILGRIEGIRQFISGAIMVALGLVFVSLQLRHKGCDCGPAATEGATQASLFSLVAFAPCYPILPLFLTVQALGWGLALGLASLFAAVTVGMMAALVMAASKGLLKARETGAWASLERYEGFILGGTLVALGAVALWI